MESVEKNHVVDGVLETPTVCGLLDVDNNLDDEGE